MQASFSHVPFVRGSGGGGHTALSWEFLGSASLPLLLEVLSSTTQKTWRDKIAASGSLHRGVILLNAPVTGPG